MKGFTLFEIVIVVAVLAILSGVGIIMINPAGQLASARNQERSNHLQAIMLAIRQNIADQSGETFSCTSGPLPTSTKRMTSDAGGYNIGPCLVPYYLSTLPFDPSTSSARFVSASNYDTGYTVIWNASTTQITLSAPASELGRVVSSTK